jgi:hypothetical protein
LASLFKLKQIKFETLETMKPFETIKNINPEREGIA